MKKNEIYKIEITDISNDGNGVGRIDKMAVFVPFTAVGDVILTKIVKVRKNYAYGIISEILNHSPDRINCHNGCAVYMKCGGCCFRHISYEAELRAKQKFVEEAFSRIGGFSSLDMPDLAAAKIEGSIYIDGYRNKAQIPLKYDSAGNVCAGFFAERSHRVIPNARCNLQPAFFSAITETVLNWIRANNISVYDENIHEGIIRHIYIRHGVKSGEVMVCLVANSSFLPASENLLSELKKTGINISSVMLNINKAKGNVILGNKNRLVSGNSVIKDYMRGIKLELSPNSFYQVNHSSAEVLYALAEDFAELTGNEVLLDLYCGIGSIGLSMAKKLKQLIGVEILPEAVENAKLNAEANNITNAEFICADVGQAADYLINKGLRPEVIITDPPRKGCDDKVLDAILRMSPKKIIMISCNPATAARDCKYLTSDKYEIKKIKPVDLFPRTHHVECVVLMTRKNGRKSFISRPD